MKHTLLLLPLALLVLLLAATCTRYDDVPKCTPPERLHYCQIDCMVRQCDDFLYRPARANVPICALHPYDALGKFWAILVQIDRKDCSDPRCETFVDTGSALMPNGSPGGASFQVQAETESGATGGFWEPVPGDTCMP